MTYIEYMIGMDYWNPRNFSLPMMFTIYMYIESPPARHKNIKRLTGIHSLLSQIKKLVSDWSNRLEVNSLAIASCPRTLMLQLNVQGNTQTIAQPTHNPSSDKFVYSPANLIFVILSILSSESLDKYLWTCHVLRALFLSHCVLSRQKQEEKKKL